MEKEILTTDFNSSVSFITYYTKYFLQYLDVPESWINFVNFLLLLAILILIVYLLQKLTKKLLSFLFKKIEKVTHLDFFKYVQKNKLPHYLALIILYTFIVIAIPTVFGDYKGLIAPILKLMDISIVFMIIWTIVAIIKSLADTLQKKPAFQNKPMKSYIQVIQIILYIFGAVAIYSVLTGKSAAAFFAAMGAASAVLILMFKDTIMGFVASIQISSNQTVMVGDWITMNKYGADGDVEEINLSNVKVRNFDKTITTIPTYSLISDSFQNWRGMRESGGRRLKRSLVIKQSDIRFLTDEELDNFQNLEPIAEYIKQKRKEFDDINKKLGMASDKTLGFRLTNCDLFINYATWYLRNNPNIHQNMTLMVRELAPTSVGLPIELYIFTNTTVWTEYERIAGEVMNHLLTAVKVFDLTIFEVSSGTDDLTINMKKLN